MGALPGNASFNMMSHSPAAEPLPHAPPPTPAAAPVFLFASHSSKMKEPLPRPFPSSLPGTDLKRLSGCPCTLLLFTQSQGLDLQLVQLACTSLLLVQQLWGEGNGRGAVSIIAWQGLSSLCDMWWSSSAWHPGPVTHTHTHKHTCGPCLPPGHQPCAPAYQDA